MKPLSLRELNGLVRETLEMSLPTRFWLAAELSEVRTAANGHCYVEFVEKDARSNALVAKARGNIWRQQYTLLAAHFEHMTGHRLTPGLKVLVEVEVTFHELYGYSLNIVDIDPTYTLGDVARRRKEILEKLEADGVLNLNKELRLPRLLSRIAVISSETAAGYGDFTNQLNQSGYAFTTCLFAATMQGDLVESSIIAALNAIVAQREQWDAVVIIRGGGAVSDLNGFDTYELAANVAQFPLPVMTGIGHERDDTVIDSVAHTRLKTPTAVAAYLIEMRRKESDSLLHLETCLQSAVLQRLEAERRDLSRQTGRFRLAATQYAGKQHRQLARLAAQLEICLTRRLSNVRRQLEELPQRLRRNVENRFVQEHHRQELLERSLTMAGPERILKMGFSITLKNGKVVRNAGVIKKGDCLVTCLYEGEVTSVAE
ncbi:exodeoxyribonuclease 7 large subunit [Bacteroidaceae bacterium]|mgnify:FL=1|uniref:exodeoxyribonuclease VII large subunit n=1 Tax=Prevotella sp. MGM2 TaxID=2033406 RepID=UPI000CEA4938|nr:exodeoxyribonuclease VII large subunit [Prevotella sp. MGM2]GAY30082.1 exodeoxyribonuclease VII large subunit [Prevotella sp. MGM2]GFI33930.1 exodeoxyribonuclease 7 large subunit [Bacteroidaceae bacterium]